MRLAIVFAVSVHGESVTPPGPRSSWRTASSTGWSSRRRWTISEAPTASPAATPLPGHRSPERALYGRYLDAWPRIGLLAQTAVMSDLQPAPSVFRCLFRITPFTPLLVFLFTCARAGAAAASNELPDGAESRAYQVAALERIARPVLVA